MSEFVFSLVERGLGWNIVRTIFASLDYVAFTVFGWATQAIFDLGSAELISSSIYKDFADRIYIIVGIFMLFKVTINLLNYLVSPDKITDKTNGLGKIVGRVIISITMLAALPLLWNLMFTKTFSGNKNVTQILLEAIPRLLIGRSTDSSQDPGAAASGNITGTTYSLVFKDNLTLGEVQEVTDYGMGWVTDHVNDPLDGDNSQYKYDYTIFLGFIIGIVMSIIMVSIAIDVAIRAFKLIILRMIAPIPIIGYILPDSTKNGGVFSNWIKTLILTWLDLFIKIAVVYLAIFFINEIVVLKGGENMPTDPLRLGTVYVFVIIGLLFFAKQAPKFITDLLGIKNSKGLGIGLGGALTFGGALLGGAGLGGAAMAGLSSMNESADALAQGKATTGSFSKGRALAAQLRTGDKNAKGGLLESLQSRLNASSANHQANRLGLSAKNVGDLKSNMNAKQDELIAAQNKLSQYQMGVEHGKYKYDSDVAYSLQENVRKANLNYQKAQSAYNDAKGARESIVRKNGVRDDYSKRGTYLARSNSSGKFERKPTDVSNVSYKSLDEVSLPPIDSVAPTVSSDVHNDLNSNNSQSSYTEPDILDMMADAQNSVADQVADQKYANGDFGDDNDIYMNGGFFDKNSSNDK